MRILDACCGSRMFWHEKELSFVDYQDNRSLSTTLCDGRKLEIKPSLMGDVTDMFYIKDGTYDMVVFDPPHLKNGGDNAWIILKYGKLPEEWKLFMKWNSEQIPFAEVVKLSPYKPIFGDKRAKTRWTVFVRNAALRKGEKE